MVNVMVLHDDLEDYASYLGVDYDDFYALVYHLPDEDVVAEDVEVLV